jgi:hypothetical protein
VLLLFTSCNSSDVVSLICRVLGVLSTFLDLDSEQKIIVAPDDILQIFEKAFTHFNTSIPLNFQKEIFQFCTRYLTSKND